MYSLDVSEKSISGLSDMNESELSEQTYDVAIFASGFETRCTSLHRKNIINAERLHVFGFVEASQLSMRKVSDKYFSKVAGREPQLTHGDDDKDIIQFLNNVSCDSDVIRILVDYTSMSRYWYGAILNWARFTNRYMKVVVDFVYSLGVYDKSDENMVIRKIQVLPGFEGLGGSSKRSVALFGLGFEGDAALCVYDRLEADVTYAYYAKPAATPFAEERSIEVNQELIDNCKFCNGYPVKSVVYTVRGIEEILLPHFDEDRITLIPMGPKPHILSALIVGLKYKNTTCLRVSGRAGKCQDVQPTGDVVGTRIRFN